MEKIFSTQGIHPRDRFDYWHDIACKNIVDHDSKPECRQTFEAEIQSGVLDDVTLVLFANYGRQHSQNSRCQTVFGLEWFNGAGDYFSSLSQTGLQ